MQRGAIAGLIFVSSLNLIVMANGTSLSKEQNNSADLVRHFPATEILELTAEQQRFTLLQRENMTSYTKGTAILLPDASEHAASPKHIDTLRQQLTDYGWHTLALTLPELPVDFSAESLEDYQQLLLERVKAAQIQAQQQPGVQIVIAQGSSAAILNHLYARALLSEPAAFVMLGAYLPHAQLNRDIAKALATHQVPTLDINHQYDNRLVSEQLRQRRQLSNKYLKAVYRQRLIEGSGYHDDTQQWVFHEIYGWLNSLGL